jgi:glucose-6-phosphate isomerase
MQRIRCDRTAAWGQLKAYFAAKGRQFDLRHAFAQDPQRFAHFSLQAPAIFADLSKNLLDATSQHLLHQLAEQTDVLAYRDAMFAGAPINTTEHRAVGHVLLRTPKDTLQAHPALQTLQQEVHATLDAMLYFAEQIRADETITDVVHIGIGGSDLGPQMTVLALDAFAIRSKRMHFVSNADGHELSAVLAQIQPRSTLFIVASKTFTTLETMTNAHSAKAWFVQRGGTDVARHFVALTTNLVAAKAFGITTTFGFWDWVGGRYSIGSAIGLPLAIAIGAEHFRQFLAGFYAMDGHFQDAPIAHNLPIQLALLDVYYRNFYGFGSRCVAPYHSSLKRYAAYLQQLEMESNGKRVDAAGEALPYATAPVVWGEPGTNGQHAYFQMLHQGSDVIPLEIIAVKAPRHALDKHHRLLLANALAQAQALMVGKEYAGGHKHFPGNRPSTFLLLEDLTPFSLGALIGLHEHRVFVQGALWGINSFDQWGVELGKVLANDIHARMQTGNGQGLDGSTAGLLQRIV